MSPLDKVEKWAALRAREILAEYRGGWAPIPVHGPIGINITGERTDRLEMAICEALVAAFNEGVKAS